MSITAHNTHKNQDRKKHQ